MTEHVSQHFPTRPAAGWTVDETAAYFGISKRSVEYKIARGEWPSSRLPGVRARRFMPEDIAAIEAAVEARRSA